MAATWELGGETRRKQESRNCQHVGHSHGSPPLSNINVEASISEISSTVLLQALLLTNHNPTNICGLPCCTRQDVLKPALVCVCLVAAAAACPLPR